MTVLSECTVLVEFADCLEDYTRRQRELLGNLRRFRAQYLETLLPPPSSLDAVHPRRSLTLSSPPPPTSDRREFAQVAAAIRPLAAPAEPPPKSELGSQTWRDDVFGSAVHPTRRNYDYFAELDDRLRSLRPPEVAP
jgi:hypothetical protein